jgi:hypothetical protein
MPNKPKNSKTKLLLELGAMKKSLVEVSKKHGLSMTAVALSAIQEKVEKLRTAAPVL